MGQMVRIAITERGSAGEQRFVSFRRFEVESKKQLTRGRAAKILAREHPELGTHVGLVDAAVGWTTQIAIDRSQECPYHYTWRHYYIAAD